VNLRPAFAAFGVGFALLIGSIVAFGVNAPTTVGALLLVGFVLCGLIGFILGTREASRVKAHARAVQRQAAQERDPWQD
jgi:uncharacterized membrane protein